MRKLFLFFFICIACQVFAQDIEVKKFELMAKDQTASLSPRKDLNGVVCGLVKVILKEPGAEFEGSVMGDVQFTGSEYLVYLPNGTKRLGIKHPDYLPTTIVFSDYGNPRIESNKTYCLVLEGIKLKKKKLSDKKKIVLFEVKPREAQLYVDEELISYESDGVYAVTLNHGIHYYSVKDKGFCINNQVVKVDGKTKPVKVDLTEFYSNLRVSIPTDNTEIYINNKISGKNIWVGMLPPGKYLIEVKKDGAATQAKTIELVENDSASVTFNEMVSLTGSLIVSYKPDGSEVVLDGNAIGVTPLHISEMPIGKHQLAIKKEYYKTKNETFSIEEGQNLNMSGFLDYLNDYSKIWVEAHNGDNHAQVKLAECFLYNRSYISGWDKNMINHKEAVYWYTKAAEQGNAYAQSQLSWCYNTGTGVVRDDAQALYWAKKAAAQDDDHGCYLVGFFYAKGYGGVEKDIKQAVYWLRKAILLDNNSSARELLIKMGCQSDIPSNEELPSH